jgi:DNA sulfur modification protein DndC
MILFDDQGEVKNSDGQVTTGIDFEEAYRLAIDSFRQHISKRAYHAIGVGYSGGKDSTTVVTLLAHAIRTSQLDIDPSQVYILYGDTGRELPPLHENAMDLLAQLRREGFNTIVVKPDLDKTFWVSMLGRGLPLSHNFSRWCVSGLKTGPMGGVIKELYRQANQTAIEEWLRDPKVQQKMKGYTPIGRRQAVAKQFNKTGQKLLMITGMRLGESVTRDLKIETICTKDGECGTGMWKPEEPEYDRLAPLVNRRGNWRTCHIFDWLAGLADFLPGGGHHGYEQWTRKVARIYGDADIRTGCLGCSVAHEDTALKSVIARMPQEYGHLAPILRFRKLWDVLMNRRDIRLWNDGSTKSQTKDLGPLTLEGRKLAYEFIMQVQAEIYRMGGRYQIITLEERERILYHWGKRPGYENLGKVGPITWPNGGWDGSQPVGDVSQLAPSNQTEIEWFGE